MSNEKTPAPAAPAAPAADLKDVRAQLGLPESAPDADVIAGLLAVIANLSEKYEALLGEAAGQEAEVANRILADYQDRIPEGTADFWRDQLLANRQATVAVLDKLPKPAAPAPKPPAPEPLRNRVPADPGREPVPAEPKQPDNAARAVTIRNRAHQIAREQNVPWNIAFERAAAEAPK